LSQWIRRRRREEYYRKAKKQGYVSRASYKLQQINRKHGIFRRGDRVLDIGCSPGGWSQVAREYVGSDGLVVGVDLDETPPLEFPNVVFLVGDIMDGATLKNIKGIASEFDVIISDASPNITGVWSTDHLLSIDLAERALELCGPLLRKAGNLAVKVFQGEELDRFHGQVKEVFSSSKRSKPKASQGQSSEIYIIGRGFLGSSGGVE
jgi:23S rRNA (uridine2552-2'-O)-methyltransferase